jgi:hypothetical protein
MDKFIEDAKKKYYQFADSYLGGTFKEHIRDEFWQFIEQKLKDARINELRNYRNRFLPTLDIENVDYIAFIKPIDDRLSKLEEGK